MIPNYYAHEHSFVRHEPGVILLINHCHCFQIQSKLETLDEEWRQLQESDLDGFKARLDVLSAEVDNSVLLVDQANGLFRDFQHSILGIKENINDLHGQDHERKVRNIHVCFVG